MPVVDMELVRNGFHIGYVEVLDLLGSDAALDVMDLFYAHVRARWQLAPKMALEPCSRGGLAAYRYAARHPDRVACIYGDVPVMDFKSWPLKWPQDKPTEWPKILSSYGFKNDAEAMSYQGNPIDQLAPIAKAKIPIRHVICLNDQVVPPEQNTLEAKRRLEALGSTIEVVSVRESGEFWGHHFPYPDIHGSVRFIIKNSSPRKNAVLHDDFSAPDKS
jgi:pimeloyl-ACP methyl ester carboxylesterase